jgi:uncharacterized protein (DUF58 family)
LSLSPTDITLLQEAERLARLLDTAASGRRASGGLFGQHRARRAGGGQEFWQYRRYAPGDPAPGIDWRRSARGQALYVRERERDVPQSYRLLIDRAEGMDYASAPTVPDKSTTALLLALTLARRALEGHEAIAIQDLQLRRLASLHAVLSEVRLRERFDLWRATAGGAVTCQILITDLLQPLEVLAAGLRHWGAQGRRNLLLVLSDPAEEGFPFAGRLLFTGAEPRPAVIFGRAEAVAEDYRTARRQHLAAVRATAQTLGWTWQTWSTGQPLLPLLRKITERWDSLS